MKGKNAKCIENTFRMGGSGPGPTCIHVIRVVRNRRPVETFPFGTKTT